MHGKAKLLQMLIANIHKALQHVKATVQQYKTADPRALLLRDVSVMIAPVVGPFSLPACHACGNGVTAGIKVSERRFSQPPR